MGPGRTLRVALGAVAPGFFLASSAWATPPATASLEWVRGRGAEQCPDGAWAREAIEERVGHAVFGLPVTTSIETTLALEPGVDGAPATHVAQIYLRRADGSVLGERRLLSDAPDCGSLADAVVLVIAVALDADAALRPSPPRATVRRPRRARAPLRCPPAPVPPRTPARRVGLAVGLRGGLQLGALPSAAGLAALVVDLAPVEAFALELAIRSWPEVRGRIGTVANAEYGVTLADATLMGCGRLALGGPWRLGLCAGTSVGARVAAGYGLGYDRSSTRPWWTVDAGARIRWAPRTVYVELSADAFVPLTRDTLVVEGYATAPEPVFTPAPVGLRLALGVGAHFE